MRIGTKIEQVRQQILSGDITLGNDIAAQGIAAILKGIHSAEWERLMNNFKNDQRELDRLCGREDAFNRSRWGSACLAYIAGNSVCTAITATDTGTVRGMTPAMIANLDAEGGGTEIFKNAAINDAYTKALKDLKDLYI